MNEDDIRAQAEAFGAALVAGDVDQAIASFSDELKRNIGEVLALFPLPATEATIESVERGGSGFVVVSRLIGESDEVEIQTRWKDRAGAPRIVEASHLSRTARADEAAEAEGEPGIEGEGEAPSA
jgi:hypothetical protein